MQKPNNYDNVQAGGNFTPLLEGGHVLVIKKVEETKSKAGKDMIIVSYDTSLEDVQPEYFKSLYEKDKERKGDKASWRGRMYILVYDDNGDTSRSFKTFTTSVEESNPGFEVKWGDEFCNRFVHKSIGGIAGKVLDAYNGKEYRKCEIRFFRSVASALEADIPDEFETKAHREQFGGAPIEGGTPDFMQISDSDLDSLPFA